MAADIDLNRWRDGWRSAIRGDALGWDESYSFVYGYLDGHDERETAEKERRPIQLPRMRL